MTDDLARLAVPRTPTSGPWELVPERTENDNFASSIYGPAGDHDGILIARADQNGAFPADALLLAAAPELLAAAKRALAVLKATGESVRPGNALGALEAAIAKATAQ